MNSSLSKNLNSRFQSYKHHGKDSDELRRRRKQLDVSLRKVLMIKSPNKNDSIYFFRLNVMNKFNLNVI